MWKKKEYLIFESYEYKWSYSLENFLYSLIQMNDSLSFIVECYGKFDNQEVEFYIEERDMLYIDSFTIYYGFKCNKIIDVSIFVKALSQYEYSNIFFIRSCENHFENKTLFEKYIRNKDLKYFAETSLFIDNSHEYISLNTKKRNLGDMIVDKVAPFFNVRKT